MAQNVNGGQRGLNHTANQNPHQNLPQGANNAFQVTSQNHASRDELMQFAPAQSIAAPSTDGVNGMSGLGPY